MSISHQQLFDFMNACKLGVLSSLASSNHPQSALVGIAVTPALEIVFDTVKHSRKYPNLIDNPRCSFVLGWEGEKTIQFEGIAHEPKESELKRYQEIYFKKWPDGPARLSWPGMVHIVVRPTWIRYSDFDQRPPLVQEFSFPA